MFIPIWQREITVMSDDKKANLLIRLNRRWDEAQERAATEQAQLEKARANYQLHSPVLHDFKARLAEMELFCTLLKQGMKRQGLSSWFGGLKIDVSIISVYPTYDCPDFEARIALFLRECKMNYDRPIISFRFDTDGYKKNGILLYDLQTEVPIKTIQGAYLECKREGYGNPGTWYYDRDQLMSRLYNSLLENLPKSEYKMVQAVFQKFDELTVTGDYSYEAVMRQRLSNRGNLRLVQS